MKVSSAIALKKSRAKKISQNHSLAEASTNLLGGEGKRGGNDAGASVEVLCPRIWGRPRRKVMVEGL